MEMEMKVVESEITAYDIVLRGIGASTRAACFVHLVCSATDGVPSAHPCEHVIGSESSADQAWRQAAYDNQEE